MNQDHLTKITVTTPNLISPDGRNVEVAEGKNGFFYVLFNGLFSAPFWTQDEALRLANHLIIGLQDPAKLHWTPMSKAQA